MKRIGFGIRFGVFSVLVFSLICFGFPAVLAQTGTSTAPTTVPVGERATALGGVLATVPSTQPDSIPVTSEQLRSEGIEEALSGRFEIALERLRRARDLRTDRLSAAAIKLLEDYLARSRRAEEDRACEYAEAVSRVRRSMLALEYLPQLAKTGMEKKLQKKVMEVASSYDRTGDSDALELASAEEAAKLKTEAAELLDAAADALAEARKLLDDDDSEYARAFRDVGKTLYDHLRQYRRMWASMETDQLDSRLDGAAKLRTLEEDMVRAIVNLEAMIVTKPWRVGLAQAQMVKEHLAPDGADVEKEDWYQAIKSTVEIQGEEAIAEARWYDAFRAYMGLRDLEPENETYKVKAKITRKHARVLGLYGKEEHSDEYLLAKIFPPEVDDVGIELTPASGPAETRPAGDERIDWREMVAGADPETVREAITKLHQYYVTAVDYRKAGIGALESIQVLAETPQAAKGFPSLAREDLRREFLQAVAAAKDHLDKRARLDHVDVQMALNTVVRASERTVDIPKEVLAVEFTEGMLEELDKFSSVIWPYDVQDFHKHTSGRFTGVGIQITKERGAPLRVMTPLPGTPAYKQGIKAGDVIVAVDGKRTENLSIGKLVRMITGKKGTRVVLSIKRPGMLKPKDFAIIRDEIQIRTVKGWRRKLPDGEWDYLIDPGGKIGYVRVTQFSEQTVSEIAEVLGELRESGVRSLVLDMRLNPGGLLRSATDVADEFLRSGRVVSTRGRWARPPGINATPRGEYLDGDLVVLVNGISASAAEIVSGAIKDWRRGIIVGERTFGKGSVQNVFAISEHRRAVLKLTTAYYYLPSGRLLHRKDDSNTWGVDPDVKVRQTVKQRDRWLRIRRKTDLIQDIDPERLSSDLAKQFDADLQLNAAVLLLKLMQLQETKSAA